MSKFKLFDRVRAYQGTLAVVGYVSYFRLDGIIDITDEGGSILAFHPKQLRKLKPKKERRRFWINMYSHNKNGPFYAYDCDKNARLYMAPGCIECIEVVEVRRK